MNMKLSNIRKNSIFGEKTIVEGEKNKVAEQGIIEVINQNIITS